MRDHPETDDRQDRDVHESLRDLRGDAATLAVEVPVHQGPLPRRFRRTTPRALFQLSTCAQGSAITRNRERYSSSMTAGPSRADSAVLTARLPARSTASPDSPLSPDVN